MTEGDSTKVHRVIFPAEIGGLPTKKQPDYDTGLLGRDLLSLMGLVYNGPQGICFVTDERHMQKSLLAPLMPAAEHRARRR